MDIILLIIEFFLLLWTVTSWMEVRRIKLCEWGGSEKVKWYLHSRQRLRAEEKRINSTLTLLFFNILIVLGVLFDVGL